MNISNLSKKIFLNEIKPFKSIQVEFDNTEDESELFQSLVSIFTEGMILLFGKNGKVNLEEITNDEFLKVIQYFRSFGIQINVHKFYIKQIEFMENNMASNNLIKYHYSLNKPQLSDEEIKNIYPELPTPDLMKNYKHTDSKDLKDYKYQLRVNDSVYIIYFECL